MLSKANQELVNRMVMEMDDYSMKTWEATLRKYAAQRIVLEDKTITEAAIKAYLLKTGKPMIKTKEHVFKVYQKRGAAYVDYASMLADFAKMVGMPVDELEAQYIKRRPDTSTISFK